MTNFIPGPLAIKVAIKGDFLGYLWTAKDKTHSGNCLVSISYHTRHVRTVPCRKIHFLLL